MIRKMHPAAERLRRNSIKRKIRKSDRRGIIRTAGKLTPAGTLYENIRGCCPKEKKTAADLIAELEEDVTSVDDLIELTESAEGVKIFGENQAHSLNQAAREAKANGGVYCICPACQAGGALLDHRDALLG